MAERIRAYYGAADKKALEPHGRKHGIQPGELFLSGKIQFERPPYRVEIPYLQLFADLGQILDDAEDGAGIGEAGRAHAHRLSSSEDKFQHVFGAAHTTYADDGDLYHAGNAP